MTWPPPPPSLKDHVVLCNASAQVRQIVKELHADMVRNRPDVVLVLQDNALWEAHPEWYPEQDAPFTREHFFVVAGRDLAADPTVLDDVCIDDARMAVILADPNHGPRADARSLLLALAIEQRNCKVHTVLELLSSPNRIHLRGTAIDEVVCVDQLTEKLIAQCCITPGVGQVFRSLLVNTPDTNNIHLVPVPEACHGMTYRALCLRALGLGLPFVPIGFVQAPSAAEGGAASAVPEAAGACLEGDSSPVSTDPPRRTYVLNPGAGAVEGRDTPLSRGDALIAIAFEPPDLSPLAQEATP